MLQHVDTLGMAAMIVEDDEGRTNAELRASTLRILGKLRVEATEAFQRYRSEVDASS